MYKSNFFFRYLKLIIFIFVTHFVYSQQELLGEWVNSYNSLLTITQQNDDGTLLGIYSSTTGSTGKYIVAGYYFKNPVNKNIAMTLLISWNSLDGSTKDPSQYWTSSMSGVFFYDKKEMQILNNIAAASSFGAVQIDQPGVYPETLTFRRKSNVIDYYPLDEFNKDIFKRINDKSLYIARQRDFLSGQWHLKKGTKSLYKKIEITILEGFVYDVIYGKVDVQGMANPLNLIGLLSKESSDFKRSLSLTTLSQVRLESQDDYTVGFTGIFDRKEKTLSLITTESRPVDFKSKYTNVRMDENIYVKPKK